MSPSPGTSRPRRTSARSCGERPLYRGPAGAAARRSPPSRLRSTPCSSPARRRMGAVAAALGSNDIEAQLFGTGLWIDPGLKLPAIPGAWLSAPDNSGFAGLRSATAPNSTPIRHASPPCPMTPCRSPRPWPASRLPVSCRRDQHVGLQRRRRRVPFPRGWANERGLAVLQIAGGATTVMSAAPKSFAAG